MKTPAQNPIRLIVPALSLILSLLASSARAAVYYWDPNGASAATSGTWDNTTHQWAPNSTLTGSTVTWPGGVGNAAGFTAGTASVGTLTVTLGTTISCAGVYNGLAAATACNVTLAGPGPWSLPTGANVALYTLNTGTTHINVPITGAGLLISQSSGQCYLEASNNWTGGFSFGFSANSWTGIVNYNNNYAFGQGSMIIARTGGGLVNSAAPGTAITIANPWTVTVANNLNIDGGSGPGTTFSGPWNIAVPVGIGTGAAVGHLITLSGVISGAGSFTKYNAGTMVLSGANTFSGGLTVSNAGPLLIGSNNAIPNGAAKGLVTIRTGATMDLNGFSPSANGLADTGTIDNTAAGTSTLTVGTGDANSVFSGVIQNTAGTVNLTKVGTGTLSLAGANTYSGITTINGGTLQLGSGTIPLVPVIVNSAGMLDANFSGNNITSLSGGGTITNCSGGLNLNGDASTTSFNAYSCFFGTVVSGGSLTKNGTHAMALRQTNSGYTLNFNSGTLSVGAVPNCLAATTDFNVPSGAVFQLDAGSQTLNSLAGQGNVNLGGGTLTINGPGTSVFTGVIQDSDLPGSSTALGHGLRGYYYSHPDFTSLAAVRNDATVNLTSSASLATSPVTNNVSVRWLGQVLSTVAGTYTFSTTSDDGQRLWVNGTLLVDDWNAHSSTLKSGTITLSANTRYDIVMEYFNGTGDGSTSLAWTPPGDTVSTVIPTDYLFLPGAGQLVVGGGSVVLAGAVSTYTGGTVVAVGATLEAQSDGSLGKGNVNLANGATLHLDSSATNGYMSTTADLITTGTTSQINLDYFGAMTIHGLSTNGGTTYLPVGTYGAVGSGAQHEISQITGGAPGTVTVTGIPTVNVLTASALTSVYGSSLTLTSTVTGSGATPTGTVTFYDGASAIGTSTLTSGKATLAVNDLLAITSPHSLHAVYGGDATHDQSTSGNLSETITPLALTFGSLTVSNKVYDATTNASLTVASATALVGVPARDANSVYLTATTANFVTKTVGTGKAANISGIALAGSLAGNYTIAATATATGNITAPPALTVTGITANNKTFDGTSNAVINVSGAILTGVISGDTVTAASGTGFFADASTGTNKPVTVTSLTLGGADSANYTVALPTGLTANISQPVIVATNISVSLIGTKVVLTWPGVHGLQIATNIPASNILNWQDIPSATSPYTNTSVTAEGYFRLKN